MTVSRRLRYEILRRDAHTCRYCGAKAPDVKLTVDHVTPEALGGTDEPTNLVTACQNCNNGKSSTPPDAELVADIERDALRWARARTSAIEKWRHQRQQLEDDLAAFASAWDNWTYGSDNIPVPRDVGWEVSVERWLRTGLDIGDLVALVPAAMQNKPRRDGRVIPVDERWRYFCGVVWRTLDDLEVATRRLLTGEEPAKTETDDVTAASYADGYEQGYWDGYNHARGAPPPPGKRLCIECDNYFEHGRTGLCTYCLQREHGYMVMEGAT